MKKLLRVLGWLFVAGLLTAQTGPTKTSIFQTYVLPNGAKGDLIYVSSTAGEFARLPIGPTESRFTVAGGVPVWESPTPTFTPTNTPTITPTPTVTPTATNTPTSTPTPATAALVRIAQVVTSSQSSVDFTSIPSTYENLIVTVVARDTKVSSVQNLAVKVNNDGTGANYTGGPYLFGNGSTASSGATSSSTAGWNCGAIPGASASANFDTALTIEIHAYARTVFYKRLLARSADSRGTPAEGISMSTTTWKNTAAINRLTFSTDGTAFVDGSVFTVYGVN